ncbi:SlyX family protein [Oceaniglobus ichthyenteri]|uniref:SlyX family protein n=1 Tax=Oceaniglobus ichthyenteri TaxID=2136177 RepID=UPI000D364DE0|nr:SlyX family protein [Oceaniglobus ichthyenteri]
MDTDRHALEERIAHLTRVVDDLSDIVTDHAQRLERVERRLAMVMQREAERELSEGGSVPLADDRPPHW